MDPIDLLPEGAITDAGPLSRTFRAMGLATFREACRRVRQMPYGYNADRDDPLALFKDGCGTCTTKHMAVGLLARELGLPVGKAVGIYPMTEALVTGAGKICRDFDLPYLPVLHCFLVSGDRRVDLTEGNRNGKNGPIRDFLHTETVAPDISAKDEYRLYRRVLQQVVLQRPEMAGVALKTLLAAREQALVLLQANVDAPINPPPDRGETRMFMPGNPDGYRTVIDKIRMKTLVYGAQTLMAEFRLARGAALPAHDHPHEQTGYLVSGRIDLTIGDETFAVQPGDSWSIPGGMRHSAAAREDSVAIEVFAPVREDYLP